MSLYRRADVRAVLAEEGMGLDRICARLGAPRERSARRADVMGILRELRRGGQVDCTDGIYTLTERGRRLL